MRLIGLGVAAEVKRFNTKVTAERLVRSFARRGGLRMTALVESSKLVGFLRVAEAWEGVGGAFAVHFNFYGAFGFSPGFAEDGKGG